MDIPALTLLLFHVGRFRQVRHARLYRKRHSLHACERLRALRHTQRYGYLQEKTDVCVRRADGRDDSERVVALPRCPTTADSERSVCPEQQPKVPAVSVHLVHACRHPFFNENIQHQNFHSTLLLLSLVTQCLHLLWLFSYCVEKLLITKNVGPRPDSNASLQHLTSSDHASLQSNHTPASRAVRRRKRELYKNLLLPLFERMRMSSAYKTALLVSYQDKKVVLAEGCGWRQKGVQLQTCVERGRQEPKPPMPSAPG